MTLMLEGKYKVEVLTVSGRIHSTPVVTVRGAYDVGEAQMVDSVESHIATYWKPGGLFPLGEVDHGVSVAINCDQIETITLRWLEFAAVSPDSDAPPAAAEGAIPADYAALAE